MAKATHEQDNAGTTRGLRMAVIFAVAFAASFAGVMIARAGWQLPF